LSSKSNEVAESRAALKSQPLGPPKVDRTPIEIDSNVPAAAEISAVLKSLGGDFICF
jgi:hypothetical protein